MNARISLPALVSTSVFFIFLCLPFSSSFAQGTSTCDPDSTHIYRIKFPADASSNCGEPVVGEVEIDEIECALLAVSDPIEEFFSASGDECYKIRRTHRVINWHEYDGISDPVVILRDEDCDNNPGDEDVWVIRRGDGITYVDRDGNELTGSETRNNRTCDTNAGEPGGTNFWASSDFNTELTSNGFWEYVQFVKVYDNVDPVIVVENFNPFCSLSSDQAAGCPGAVTINFTVSDVCTPDDITISAALDQFVIDQNADGTLNSADFVQDANVTGLITTLGPGNYQFTGSFPLGQHMLEIVAEDGCNNTAGTYLVFEVVDCKAPAPICINGLAIDLLPTPGDTDVDGDGEIDKAANAIWAVDFIVSSIDDCSPPIKYSINRVGDTPDIDQDGIVVTCPDANETVLVEIYAWDSANNPYAVQPDGTVGGPNYDYCETYVIVQDNNQLCVDEAGTIAGTILTENAETVEGVTVALSGDIDMEMTTSVSGEYMFTSLAPQMDYTITPALNTEPLNGVSTFDIVLLMKHILGVQTLDSPYKMIAADVNNSGSVSTVDAIVIQKLILGFIDEFPATNSWRFIDANHVFDPNNPWAEPFPEIININNLPIGLSEMDFIGVKMGDLNDSAQSN